MCCLFFVYNKKEQKYIVLDYFLKDIGMDFEQKERIDIGL